MTEPRRHLITGASSGIGAATARHIAAEQTALWLTYHRDVAGIEETASACVDRGAEVEVSQLDLASPAGIATLLAEIGSRWGRLHVLVNNAGICPYTQYSEISVEEWDEVFATNVRGMFLLSRGALDLMREADGDRSIVNVSSVAGEVGGLQTSVHYAASKAAILGITRSFARLLASDGIRVNAVAPGAVETSITAQLSQERLARLAAGAVLGRLGSVDEVAPTIAHLASPSAGFTTGATYDVNGGARID